MSAEDIRNRDAGCCETPGVPTPEEITNRPGLPTIRYRAGTYSSFRRAMIEDSASVEVVDGERKTWPLRDWTTRAGDDYGMALLEMWAYLADILTFYQERIANEAFLRTATLPESVRSLVALLGYEPATGAAASAHLAFAVEKGKRVEISEGLRAQSVPGQDEKPQKFETTENMLAWSSLNEMRPRPTEPQAMEVDRKGVTNVDVEGTETGLEAGDYILLVEKDREDHPDSERWEVRRLTGVEPGPQENTTRISWDKELGKLPHTPAPEDPRLFVLGIRAYPFGYAAPDHKLLSAELKKVYTEDWNSKYLPEDTTVPNHIFLDAVYDRIEADGWIALITTKPLASALPPLYGSYVELYRVEKTIETVRVGYTLTAAVTRLTVDGIAQDDGKVVPPNIDLFPMQGTIVLAQTEELTLARGYAKSRRLMTLDGYYPELEKGRKLILTGETASASAEGIVGVVQVEDVTHKPEEKSSLVTFVEDLPRVNPETVRLYGNATEATHGETVAGEVLGSGDASSAFQSFTVRRSPVTFVRNPGAPRGTASTLRVRVGSVEWHEVPSLHGHGGDERIFTTSVDEEGTMRVRFGDGKTGARLPSGRDNVVATYRQGLGREGIVAAGSLKTLLDRPVGLRSVTNPAAAEGGVEREGPQEARANAPNTVRTFDRIVSLRDFEDAAREFVGVAKAQAALLWKGDGQSVQLTVAGQKGTDIHRLCADLQTGLDGRRDPNRRLDVVPYDPVKIRVRATVHVHPDHLEEAVLAAARRALEEAFAFERLELGQDINLSDTYRVLQEVEGVLWAFVDGLHFKGVAQSVEARLPIEAGRLAVIDVPADDIVVTSGEERT